MEYWIKNHLFSQIEMVLVTMGLVLIGGLSMSSVLGQASTSMDNFRTLFESTPVPLCGGEEIVFSGTVHFRFKDTTNPTGAFPQLVQMNYQDIKGVGVVSGDNYIVNEVNNFKVDQNPDSDIFHTVVLSDIIHQGQKVNTVFTVELQTLLDGDGIPKTSVVHISVGCPGS
jgi:hypothetical protein